MPDDSYTYADKVRTLKALVAQLDERCTDPDDQIQILGMAEQTARSALRQAVPAAVRRGTSWRTIGRLLGVTGQAAWERYRQPIEPAAADRPAEIHAHP